MEIKMGKIEKATFAAGCFWHIEEVFRGIKGVKNTTVGYIGGHMDNPTYNDVCSDSTGHAEAIEIEFDQNKVSYEQLLTMFWENHDPTSFHKQGPDVGSQYRAAIFYHNEKQKQAATKSKNKLQKSEKFKNKKIVTEIAKASKFYPAEEYHQKYFEKHKLQKMFMCRM
jgi:peptide-methionine (S)-S-oxide reductase